MNAANLRRQDTTKGPPLRILSLDGGGVRGYSMLILLQELMHRTHVEIHGRAPRPNEIPKPCDHFDLIAGTGTGGLIAIMLGRLRLDLETCKDVYIRMTKRVFETDKTFAGIPYRSTLFKASKLEEAIRDCVREHTVYDDEGNDELAVATPMTPQTPTSASSGRQNGTVPSRSGSTTSRMSVNSPAPYSPSFSGRSSGVGRRGNPNALLYDVRETRTKTAVTAVYKGARVGDKAVFLRSYDSRKEPAPEFNCAIWQAGRATAATGLAFKPIQIGQSVFIDEGPGRYNPSPSVLDEAVINEYPSRDVGVFISIGTGKRPPGTGQRQSEWWEGFMGGSMGDFAEARRRLISKIEGCEETHQYMLHEHLAKRGMNPENYYRLNVEVGVGEFGMNEWSRLSDISTNTRRYLSKEEVQSINFSAATRIGRIHRAKVRWEKANGQSSPERPYSFEEHQDNEPIPPSDPMAIELPADVPTQSGYQVPPYPTTPKFPQPYVPQQPPSQQPHLSQRPEYYPPQHQRQPHPQQPHPQQPHYQQHRPSYDDKIPIITSNDTNNAPPPSNVPNPEDHIPPQNYAPTPGQQHQGPVFNSSPPPLPPKTPIQDGRYLYRPTQSTPGASPRNSGEAIRRPSPAPPYPDPDGPPPPVNMGNKPQYGIRYGPQ